MQVMTSISAWGCLAYQQLPLAGQHAGALVRALLLCCCVEGANKTVNK
jgi:hypothetical protein